MTADAKPAAETAPNSTSAGQPQTVERRDQAGNLVERVALLGGVAEGERQAFAPNGRVLSRQQLSAGKPDGLTELFDETGVRTAEMTFVGGLLHGHLRSYVGGELQREARYAIGQLHGTTRSFGPGGVVTAEESYRAGRRHGPTRLFDAAGRKLRELDYADGQPVGTARTFYPLSGRLQEATPLADGKPHGWQVAYHPDGKTVQRRQHFQAGKSDGLPALYDHKGRPLDAKSGKAKRKSWWRRLLG